MAFEVASPGDPWADVAYWLASSGDPDGRAARRFFDTYRDHVTVPPALATCRQVAPPMPPRCTDTRPRNADGNTAKAAWTAASSSRKATTIAMFIGCALMGM